MNAIDAEGAEVQVASELILPKVRTRHCRVPTINWRRETALP